MLIELKKLLIDLENLDLQIVEQFFRDLKIYRSKTKK